MCVCVCAVNEGLDLRHVFHGFFFFCSSAAQFICVGCVALPSSSSRITTITFLQENKNKTEISLSLSVWCWFCFFLVEEKRRTRIHTNLPHLNWFWSYYTTRVFWFYRAWVFNKLNAFQVFLSRFSLITEKRLEKSILFFFLNYLAIFYV